MGKINVLIEGVAGSGKSTVCKELKEQGYSAVDADKLCYFGNPETGEPVDVVSHETWIWDEEKIIKKLNNDDELLFICGGARNRDKFLNHFNLVFNLRIDKAALKQRIKSRTNNPWGKKREEFNKILQLHKEDDQPKGAIEIDATQPVNKVVTEILRQTPSL